MISSLAVVAVSLTLAAAPAPALTCPTGDAPDVAALVAYTERALQGQSSMKGTMTMTIKTPSWTRSLKLALTTKGTDYALIRVVEGGPREVGMMTLKREKQLWNYLPQAGRVMKLPSGMLGDSWMGSDFTNDDLVRGSSMSKDFDASAANAGGAWKLTLIPKKDAVVVWGKVEMTLDKKTCVPLEQRFFDEEMKLARTMTFANVKKIGTRDFPTKMTVAPAEGGKQTVIEYADVSFDADIPDDTFSLHRLQQGR